MKKIISCLVIIFLLTACGNNLNYETIDTNKALELIDNGAIILDVRTVEEFNREHIPNAINIPLDQIDSINFNKDSISYTVSNGKASYTYNPKKKMETKNVKLSKDLSLIDKKKINKNETKVVNPKLCDFFSNGLKNFIKTALFASLLSEGTVYEEGFVPLSDDAFITPTK